MNSIKKCIILTMALVLVWGLWGCRAERGAVTSPTAPPHTATPRPTAAPVVSEDAFRAAFLDELPPLPSMGINGYGDLAEHAGIFRDYLSALPDAVGRAFKSAAPRRNESVGVNAPGWRYIAALYMRYGEGLSGVLAQSCETALNDALPSVTIGGPERLYGILPNADVFSVTLAYAYLNTIYDDEGQEIPYIHPELNTTYLKNLHDPLPGRHIKDGWYNDRDKGARKHTGTDIRAPEGTDILSCTNGKVLYIDTNDSAGYYVVVRDTLGYEYHYYHMVRMTDFLKTGDYVMRGQVIGHVGNTGNSAANHVHLTIISPDYTFINPYTVLKDMREMQE